MKGKRRNRRSKTGEVRQEKIVEITEDRRQEKGGWVRDREEEEGGILEVLQGPARATTKPNLSHSFIFYTL